MTNTKQIREELGHDGLVLWQPFKNWAMARNWNLDDMSPNELDEYYALFKAGHDHGQQALVAENQALRERVADANRGAQVNALVNESLAKKLKLAVEALSDARSHLFAIYNGDWPSDISPTPAGFAQFAVNDIDATLAKIKEPLKGGEQR